MKDLVTIFAVLLCSVFCYYGVVPLQCYTCVGKCADPIEVEMCESDWICWSLEGIIGNETGITKECVENTEKTFELCKVYNQEPGLSCYTCDTDLCNGKNIVNKGTQKCYTCQGDCSDPLEVEECPSLCGTDYACMSYTFLKDDGATATEKGCVPKVGGITDLCQNVDQEGSVCYICDNDLCNEQNNKKINCYFCEGTCEDGPKKQECPYACGQNYGCMSYKFVKDNITYTQKSCVPKNTRITELCNSDEKCYICNQDMCNKQDVSNS